MATMTVTIPDEAAMRVAAAICGRENYVPTSPEDATNFVKQTVFRWLRDATIEWEIQQTSDYMRSNADDPLIAAVLDI